MGGLFTPERPSPPSFQPRHEFPDPDDWSVTPGRLADIWGEMWGHVEEAQAEVADQVAALEAELAHLREAKASRQEVQELREVITGWKAAAEALHRHYNYAAELYFEATGEVIQARVQRELNLDEDDADHLVVHIGEEMWPERPAIEHNHALTLEAIYGQVVEALRRGGFLDQAQEQRQEPTQAAPTRALGRADQLALFGA